jgi:hypothetical protein
VEAYDVGSGGGDDGGGVGGISGCDVKVFDGQ